MEYLMTLTTVYGKQETYKFNHLQTMVNSLTATIFDKFKWVHEDRIERFGVNAFNRRVVDNYRVDPWYVNKKFLPITHAVYSKCLFISQNDIMNIKCGHKLNIRIEGIQTSTGKEIECNVKRNIKLLETRMCNLSIFIQGGMKPSITKKP